MFLLVTGHQGYMTPKTINKYTELSFYLDNRTPLGCSCDQIIVHIVVALAGSECSATEKTYSCIKQRTCMRIYVFLCYTKMELTSNCMILQVIERLITLFRDVTVLERPRFISHVTR